MQQLRDFEDGWPLIHPGNAFGRSAGRRVQESLQGNRRRHLLSHRQLFGLIPFPSAILREKFESCVEKYRHAVNHSFPPTCPDPESSLGHRYGDIKISNTPLWLIALGLREAHPDFTIDIVDKNELGRADDDAFLIEATLNRNVNTNIDRNLEESTLAAYPFVEHIHVVGRQPDEDPMRTTVLYLPSCGMMYTVFGPNKFRHDVRFKAFSYYPLPSSDLRIRISDGEFALGGFFEADSVERVCRISFTGIMRCGFVLHHWPDAIIQLVPDFINPSVWDRFVSNTHGNQEKYHGFMKKWHTLPVDLRGSIWSEMLKSSTSNRSTNRRYVKHMLYKNLDECTNNTPLVIDLENERPFFQIILRVIGNRHDRSLVSETSTIRIMRLEFEDQRLKKFDNCARNIQRLLKKKKCQTTVRKTDGSLGQMFAVGKHWHNGTSRLYCGTTALNVNGDLAELMEEYGHLLEEFCPLELFCMRSFSAGHGQVPPVEMGTSFGPTLSMNISSNLANPSHFNTADKGPGVSIWHEDCPGMAKNWNFVLPSLVVENRYDRNVADYAGLYVKLCHRALIQWDGVAVRHCTSVTNTGNNNMVYGFHIVPNIRSLNGLERVEQLMTVMPDH